jgi:uncharacterized membrane protein YfcA
LEFALVLALGLVAGTVGGVLGFGTAIMLLPALVLVFGPREAVPIMAVASIMANASRVVAWWRELDWRVVFAYSATAVPAAALGARTLLELPTRWGELALGIFFIAMIFIRRRLDRLQWKPSLGHMALVGASIGFITGIVATTGPINAPFFVAYGLVKGAYVGTEALASLFKYASKVATFHLLGAMPWATLAKGLLVGSSLVAGAFVAKRVVQRMPIERFKQMVDGLMLLAGLTMLCAAWHA